MSTTAIRKFSGTGSPEGVVMGPKGSTYDQTDGANGNELWEKATGTGNTGWRVAGTGGSNNVATVSALESLTNVADGDTRNLLGNNASGDGGGGIVQRNAASTATRDGGVVFNSASGGRFTRISFLERPLNVLWWGATGANATVDTAAFQAAIAYSTASNAKKTIEVPKLSQPYYLNQELVLTEQRMFSHDPQTQLAWPSDLGSGKHAITLTGGTGGGTRCYLENLQITGSGSVTLGTAPRLMNGIRCGRGASQSGSGNNPLLRNVNGWGFNYGVVLDNDTGHIPMYDSNFSLCYYGMYVRRGNGDYYFANCSFSGSYAGIGLPRNAGLVETDFERCQIGFSPYGIYQSNTDDAAIDGPTEGGFLSSSTLQRCSFEACGNGMVISDADGTGGSGNINGNHFLNCYQDFSDSYKITANDRNWTIRAAWGDWSYVHSGGHQWSVGDLGLIKVQLPGGGYSGGNAWELKGWLPDVTGSQVLLYGDTSLAVIRRVDSVDRQVTVSSGATTATYTLNEFELAMTDDIKPTASPLSNPGSNWWLTKSSTAITVNLASAAPSNVTFNLHLSP